MAQVALAPKAMGFGEKKLKATIEPTVLQVTSKDLVGNDVTSTICTLDHTCRQVSVALTFGWDEEVTFSLASGGGKGPVSITGYLQPSPDGMDNEDDMMYGGEDDSDDDEDEDAEVGESDDDEDEDDEDEEDDEGDEDEAPTLQPEKRKRSFDVSAAGLAQRASLLYYHFTKHAFVLMLRACCESRLD